MIGRPGLTPGELKSILEAERASAPFLFWRSGSGSLEILVLADRTAVSVGRRSSNDIALSFDPQASRAHARLERIGDDWVLLDNGISRNGTFVDGMRATQRIRLADGSRMRFGSTVVEFRNPRQGQSSVTQVPVGVTPAVPLSDTQRRILVALCRPRSDGNSFAPPASNLEIAQEVFLGVDAVKAQLRELYRKFGIDLPHNQKRARLVERVLQQGLLDA